jgi:glyceraldehyde 3-phosphate dehydrogenase
MVNIAINGFGRIGRQAFRAAWNSKKVKIVAINDLTDTRTLAHLLKYDTAYGTWPVEVSFDEMNLIVGTKKIPVFAEKDPAVLPWKKNKVEVVLECTGRFTNKEGAQAHIPLVQKKLSSVPRQRVGCRLMCVQ